MSRADSIPSRLIGLVLLLLLSVGFCLATCLEPCFRKASMNNRSTGFLTMLLGDSRRMFANHFFVKADAYFHAGYYPTIFDRRKAHDASASPMLKKNRDDAPGHEHDDHEDHDHDGHEKPGEKHDDHEAEGLDFLNQPADWIERFGRHFFPTTHVHLENGKEREILPWLKLSADLDPQRVETYVTAGYWLNHRLGKPAQAEAFLRQGLRANPDSYEILSELGSIYAESKKEPEVARTLWELALQKVDRWNAKADKPNEFVKEQILTQLVNLEKCPGGDPARLIHYLEALKEVAVNKKMVEQQIQEAKLRTSSDVNPGATPSR